MPRPKKSPLLLAEQKLQEIEVLREKIKKKEREYKELLELAEEEKIKLLHQKIIEKGYTVDEVLEKLV